MRWCGTKYTLNVHLPMYWNMKWMTCIGSWDEWQEWIDTHKHKQGCLTWTLIDTAHIYVHMHGSIGPWLGLWDWWQEWLDKHEDQQLWLSCRFIHTQIIYVCSHELEHKPRNEVTILDLNTSCSAGRDNANVVDELVCLDGINEQNCIWLQKTYKNNRWDGVVLCWHLPRQRMWLWAQSHTWLKYM